MGYGRYQNYYYRTDAATGRRIEMGYDSTCICGKHAAGTRIKAVVTNHVCDARCTSATGHQCECQCGGKNHGAQYLVVAA